MNRSDIINPSTVKRQTKGLKLDAPSCMSSSVNRCRVMRVVLRVVVCGVVLVVCCVMLYLSCVYVCDQLLFLQRFYK